MATEFKLPDLGENIESGSVVSILVAVGDTIEPEQPVLELETDKATVEVPSSVSGVVKEIMVKEGDDAQVGQVLLIVESANGEAAQSDQKPADAAQQEPPAESQPPEAEASTQPEPPAPNGATGTQEFHLPDLGENIEMGTVVSVLVSAGDTVTKEQGVLELETDKATLEVPVSVAGVVQEIHVKEGDEVAVGQLILTVEGQAEAAPEQKQKPAPKAEPQQEPEQKPASPPKSEPESTSQPPPPQETPTQTRDIPQPSQAGANIPATPKTRRYARELGVNLSQVPGTGPQGLISEEDIKSFTREALSKGMPAAPATNGAALPDVALPDFSKWGNIRREKMSGIRKATATHLTSAWLNVPRVTQFDKAYIDELDQLRRRYSEKAQATGGKLTVTAILLKVATAALKAFPKFNASIDMANREIIYKDYYHLGVAVDTEKGLVVPVIRDVDRKNIMQLAVELNEFAEKARDGKLSMDDMQGATFTITNLGGIGGTNFTPIVNAPEVAILGVARGSMEPVYNGETFEPRLSLPLALSYDHRLIDGADAARFLRWMVDALENPFAMSFQSW